MTITLIPQRTVEEQRRMRHAAAVQLLYSANGYMRIAADAKPGTGPAVRELADLSRTRARVARMLARKLTDPRRDVGESDDALLELWAALCGRRP